MNARSIYKAMIKGAYDHLDSSVAQYGPYQVSSEGDLNLVYQNGTLLMSHSVQGPSEESFFIDHQNLTTHSFYEPNEDGTGYVRIESLFKKYMN